MTVIVGVRCSDGIVIGADGAATSSAGQVPVLRTETDKIFLVGDRIILAGTGSVGLIQRFNKCVEAAWNEKSFQTDAMTCGKLLTKKAMEDFESSYVQKHPQVGFQFGVVLGGIFADGFELIEFDTVHFQPEIHREKLFFVSLGSGQSLADPFIAFVKRVLWKNKPPTVDMAKIGVAWALNHTITCAPGYVGHPISLAVLKRDKQSWKASLLGDEELQEQSQYIDQLEEHIGTYLPKAITNAQTTPPPEPPAKA